MPPSPMIYLDHNSTSPMLPEVADAIDRCLRAGCANPVSQHAEGRRARRMLEDARERVATILGARTGASAPDRVIFTSGGTEANNLAIRGLAPSQPGQIIISAVEHPSVAASAEELERRGHALVRLPVSKAGTSEARASIAGASIAGTVELDPLREALSRPTRLVSVMAGNHETGVLQPLEEISRLCRHAEVLLHCDAVQAVGKISLSFAELDVDAMSCSAHKLHGPVGIGALVVRHGVEIEPILYGGAHQLGLRPGTESVALAVGFSEALHQWQLSAREQHLRLASLRNRFEALVREALPGIVINGGSAQRLPHTSNIGFPGLDRQRLLMALDLAGVACSTGTACASGSTDPSPVLTAMDCPPEVIRGSLRFSLGATTTPEDVSLAAERIIAVVREILPQGFPKEPGWPAREEARSGV